MKSKATALESKATVLVGRKWNNPQITVTVSNESIGIQLGIQDFIHALAMEAGNPTTLLTVAGLEKRLKQAADIVLSGMKAESARVL